jgi:carbonic anhydrase/acetyltransferase-like protein (isoleucine patch superfamily)
METSIPAGNLVLGSPAKVIRELTGQEIEQFPNPLSNIKISQ